MSERHPDCNVSEDLRLIIEKAWKDVLDKDDSPKIPLVDINDSESEIKKI